MANSWPPFELEPARLPCPWGSSGKSTGVGCHFLLQGIFPTQESNLHLLCLLHCRQMLYPLSHQRSPKAATLQLKFENKNKFSWILNFFKGWNGKCYIILVLPQLKREKSSRTKKGEPSPMPGAVGSSLSSTPATRGELYGFGSPRPNKHLC